MAGQPMTVSEAWTAYRAFRQLPDVVLLEEPFSCEAILGAWASAGVFFKAHWTDAYLAAFAKAGGLRLVSFDSDFSRFDGLDFLHLESSPT